MNTRPLKTDCKISLFGVGEGEDDADGAVVAAGDVRVDGCVVEVGEQALADEEVVDTPADVLLPGLIAVTPPGVRVLNVAVDCSEGVHESGVEQPAHAVALLVGEAGTFAVRFGVLEVYLPVCHIHIAADDYRFMAVEFENIVQKLLFPVHPVVQPGKFRLRIGRVDVDEVKTVVFERYGATLVVVALNPDALADAQRVGVRNGGRAGVALLVGGVVVGLVAVEIEVNLTLLQLGFLQAEPVGGEVVENIGKSFAKHGPQAIHIPRNEFHTLKSQFACELRSLRVKWLGG